MLYVYAADDAEEWMEPFRTALPGREVAAWPQKVTAEHVHYLAVWNPPEGFFSQFPALRGVFVLGAGVDRLLGRTDLPPHIPLVRLVDAGMARQMAEYALLGVLRFHRDMDRYALQQATGQWQALAPKAAADVRVSVLGLGAMGSQVARTLADFGYTVSGWSRGAKTIPGIRTVFGLEGLETLLPQTDVLVNVLPSTPETRGLLNRERLQQLPRGAAVINTGRGDQLHIDALVELLDNGHLRGAQLDVFSMEPIPAESPLWQHPNVVITPHIAAATLVGPAVEQIAQALHQLEVGEIPTGWVEHSRNY